jgi:tetratricopeptide (TPR) repeat protein
LDGLPLALASAGAFLRQITLTFAEYLRLWDESWKRLQYATPALLPYEDRTLWSTWGISLEHVKLQDSLAGKLLQYWAYFDNEDLWFELIKIDKSVRIPAEALWVEELTQDKLRFETAIKVLCDYGFVETSRSSGATNTDSHGYSIHSCVHSWVTHFENTGPRNAIPAMRQAAFCSIGLFIREKPRDHSLTRRLLPHFRRRLGFLKNDLEQASESERSELEYSIKTFSEFLLDTIRRLAVDYRCQGGITEAEKLLSNGLELYSTSLFFESSTVGCELFLSIGFLYSTQSYDSYSSPYYAIAEKNFQKALQCNEKYPFMTADHLTEIAIFYESRLQLYSKAREIHEIAIGILTSDKSIDHSAKLVQKLFFLGRNYLHSVDYPNAKFTLKAALEMCIKAFGPGHKKCKDMASWVEAMEAQQHLPVLFLLFCKDKYELDCRLNSIPDPFILGWNDQPIIIRF